MKLFLSILLVGICFCTAQARILHQPTVPKEIAFYDSLYRTIASTKDADFFVSLKDFIYDNEDIPDSSKFEIIIRSIEATQKLGLEYHNATFVYFKSVMATLAGDYSTAIDLANKSLKVFLEHSKYSEASACYNTIGGIVAYKGDIKASKKYLQKAIQYNDLEKKGKLYKRRKIDHLTVYGTIFYQTHDYDSMILLTQQALTIAHQNNFVRQESFCLNNIGSALEKKKQYELAKTYFHKALKVAANTELQTLKATVYRHLASISSNTNAYDSAVYFIEKGIKVCENNFSFLPVHLSLLSEKSNVLGKMGEISAAHAVLKEYIVLKDSLFTLEKEKDRQWIEAEFGLQNKERDIKALSQQAAIQALEIRQKNQTIFIGLIIIVFVLAIVYLFYRQRSLRKEQSYTELEQRFLRSQLNPHFISNALSAVQHYILKKQPDQAARYLAKFSKLMREILENSRQEFILVKDELQMLTNYLDIHQLRMDKTFEYQLIVGEEINPNQDRIPPMFVQPFVENAIEHGLIQANNQGTIALTFTKKQNYIYIEIRDNGGGLATVDNRSDHQSLSTTIIRERMALFNRSLKHKIELLVNNYQNERGEIQGTKVELKVPFFYL